MKENFLSIGHQRFQNVTIGHQRFQNVTSGMLSMLIYTEQYELRVFLLRRYQQLNEKFLMQITPLDL